LRVEVVRGRAGFAALASEWDALAGRTHAELFHRHAFLSCWLEHFAPEAPLRVLTARARDGRLVAALALREVRTRYFGVPVRELRSVCNAHSSRFDMLAEDPEGAGAAFLSHLAADPSWDVLCVTHLSEGAAGWALLEASRRAGLPAGVWHSGASPYVPLPGSLKAWEARPRSNRKTLRRKRRRLAERGEVTVQRVASAEGLDALLEEGFRVESSGWKARNGTAVLQDAGTRGFYAGLAHQAAARGELALYFLRLDGKPVAFQFGLTDGPRYLAMKPGYDESLGSLSPGQLLTESVLEDCAHRGLRELDLLGDDTPSKREWTDQVRQHGWLFVFRDSLRGRALKEAKFRVVPLARRAAHGTSQRLSRVRHAVSRLRPQRGA
jgi:CelD/BcsL family acetyltransferase involved in cellulose biosynthesis